MATRKKSKERRRGQHWRCGSMMLVIELRHAMWNTGLLTHQLAALTGLEEDVFRKHDFEDMAREQVIEVMAVLNRFIEEQKRKG